MCTDLSPDIQDGHCEQILPALMAAMDDFNAPRVQAHAAAAVVNFSEGAEADLMAPHLDALIAKLLTLLQRGKRLVQEGALTAIASVADSAEELFVKYYDAVMPLLSSILLNARDKQVPAVGGGGACCGHVVMWLCCGCGYVMWLCVMRCGCV